MHFKNALSERKKRELEELLCIRRLGLGELSCTGLLHQTTSLFEVWGKVSLLLQLSPVKGQKKRMVQRRFLTFRVEEFAVLVQVSEEETVYKRGLP